jgi:hypothetical protein
MALSDKIQNFHWNPCALALRFNLKNSKIGYRTRELWAFFGEAGSWSVRSSVQTHLHFSRRFYGPQFWNSKFLFPLWTLRSYALIQSKKLENRISYEGAMSFFWWSRVVVGRFFSSDTSSLFQAFLWPCVLEFKILISIENLAVLCFDSS